MALERRNPLPAGFYSVDLPNNLVPEFTRWRSGRSSVKVLKTNDDGEFSWILFSVSSPTQWGDARVLGFPDISKPTDEKPQAFEPSKDILDQIAETLPSPAQAAEAIYMVGFIGIGLVAYLYRKELFGHVRRRISRA
jgi:hypothetical protein